MNYQPLKYIYKSSGNPAAPTLLLLHGTGGDEKDLLSLADNFGNGINVLSLRGNVSEGGMPRFFKRLGMGVFDEEDLTSRTHELVEFVKGLSEKEGFDPGKIIALGYSNGANITGSILVLYPDFLAGAILYRPMQPFKTMPESKNSAATPIFLSTGKMDPTINPENTVKYIEKLKNMGFDVTHVDLTTSHGLTNADITLSVDWFHNHFNKEKSQ
ncbi:MAG TPA: alpha/beta hydrolase [Chitinophagaceae bacterium]|nr:alpha/beta hydrolase [Chitinophagaceae bacterium]